MEGLSAGIVFYGIVGLVISVVGTALGLPPSASIVAGVVGPPVVGTILLFKEQRTTSK